MDKGFQKFLDCLKVPDLTDLEERFLVQLAATLVVYMAALEEPAKQLPSSLHVWSSVVSQKMPLTN